MPDLSPQVMSKILSHRIGSLPLDKEMILPFYDGYSLVNIPCTISKWLTGTDFGNPPLNAVVTDAIEGSFKKIVLFLVDALDLNLFERMRHPQNDLLWGKYSAQAVYTPLTSICPSTTASALTTLWTGEGPASHGIIGFEMWAKEFGMVMNNIYHSPANAQSDMGGLVRSGFSPSNFLNKPLLGTHLLQQGVKSSAFMQASIARSGLSTMQMVDVDIHPYFDEADLFLSLAELINRRPGKREYIYVYYSDVDTLMHRYNAGNPRVAYQFEVFSDLLEKAFLQNLTQQGAQDTLMILTADHGSIATPHQSKYDLANHPELMDCLVMQPTCENRLAFLYLKPGKEASLRDYFTKTWPDEFILLDSISVLESGLFGKGPFKANVNDRLGDLIAVARGDAYLWWAPKPNLMAGRHGGLSQEEMLVPFYALPLGGVV